MSRGYIALYRRIDCEPARAWAMERKYGGNTPPYFLFSLDIRRRPPLQEKQVIVSGHRRQSNQMWPSCI